MALIECSRCGKKYSDSVNKCIHCGCVCSEEKDEDVFSEKSSYVLENATAGEDDSVNYFDLPVEYMLKLEAEFLEEDEKSLKFEQKRQANKMMKKTCTIFFLFSFILFGVVFLFGHHINNLSFVIPFWVSIISLLVIGLLGWIVFFVRGIVIWQSKQAERYSKTYANWLKKEKNIIMKF